MLDGDDNSAVSGREATVKVLLNTAPQARDAVFQQADQLGVSVHYDTALSMYFVSGARDKIAQFLKAIQQAPGEQTAANEQVVVDVTLDVQADATTNRLDYKVVKVSVSDHAKSDNPLLSHVNSGGSTFVVQEWLKNGLRAEELQGSATMAVFHAEKEFFGGTSGKADDAAPRWFEERGYFLDDAPKQTSPPVAPPVSPDPPAPPVAPENPPVAPAPAPAPAGGGGSSPANEAPVVALALADQNAVEDAAFSFQFAAGTFTDANGDILTYTAALASGAALPAWLSFDPATRTFSGTPANGDVGTISVKVTADDGQGGTVDDTFDLTVANTNDAPTVANAIANQNATEGSAFSFQFAANTFADVDAGASLTYAATLASGAALPAWLTFTPGTRTFSGTPAGGDVGTISVKVTADDGQGGTVDETFDLAVADANDPPVVTATVADTPAPEGAAFTLDVSGNLGFQALSGENFR